MQSVTTTVLETECISKHSANCVVATYIVFISELVIVIILYLCKVPVHIQQTQSVLNP